MMLTVPCCSGQIVYFGGIREARFFKAILPGSAVRLMGHVVSVRHGVFESSMEAWTGGVRATAAAVTCTFCPRRRSSNLDEQIGS